MGAIADAVRKHLVIPDPAGATGWPGTAAAAT